jgi:SAM-dependent methyltransferase
MKLYQEHPDIYDKLYGSMKDYAGEVNRIKSELPSDASILIDFGCGTGLHDQYFAEDFDVVGVDRSAEMLGVAQEKNPGAYYVQDDIVSASLDRTFDAAVCLFGVVSYLDDAEELAEAIRVMAEHLAQNGVLVIDFVEPHRKEIAEGPLRIETYREEGLRVTRTGIARIPADDKLVMQYHTAIADDSSVTSFDDVHELKHFSAVEYRSAFRDADLDAELVGEDWPLWVAKK